ncbi:MAG: hypothetical protein A3G97_08490 [Candidatus Rokubacteria bacterium RIFCSPLOWO2_12_FULL_69_21]|nr:MAG: hypothetical protein A3G97_08490 [Candidatus Rokubacteria bacterium RIFCSPLOWO2_12_FULL_69_21]
MNTLNHAKRSVTARAARNSAPIRKIQKMSNSIPLKKPRPRLTPRIRSSTRRLAPKSWVENRMRITVPRIPDTLRVATIRRRMRPISFWYTGMIGASCLMTWRVASSLDRMNPSSEMIRNRNGIRQIMK